MTAKNTTCKGCGAPLKVGACSCSYCLLAVVDTPTHIPGDCKVIEDVARRSMQIFYGYTVVRPEWHGRMK